MKYSEKILKLFYDVNHANKISAEYEYKLLEKTAGDEAIKFYLQFDDKEITTARFITTGNTINIAVCEYLCRQLEAQNISQFAELSADAIITELEIDQLYAHNVYFVLDTLRLLKA